MAKALAAKKDTAGTAYTPEFTTQDNGHGYPRIPVEPPFLYIYDPARWMVLSGRLVPRLIQAALVEGVNCVQRSKDGRWKLSMLRAKVEEQGRTVLPFDWAPDGQSYIQQVETRHGLDVVPTHISCFSSAHAGDATVYGDSDAYSEWLASLVDSGRLPACPPHRAKVMLEDTRARLLDAESIAAKHPSAARAAKVDSLRAEIAALEAVVSDTPTTKRATAKAVKPAMGD